MARPDRPGVWSLRNRLFAIAALAAIAAWLIGGAAVYQAAGKASDALYDNHLEHLATAIVNFAGHELEEIRTEGKEAGLHVETAATLDTRYRYQLWSSDGELLLRSANASPTTPLMALDRSGYHDATIDGEAMRVFALRGAHAQSQIQVAEAIRRRTTVLGDLGAGFFAFVAVAMGLLFMLSWVLLHNALAPVSSAASQLARRGPLDLSALTVVNPPLELAPILASVNRLFARIERTLSDERGFTSMAAHELRTPLAAVRLQAQVAGRARDAAARERALAELVRGVDRISHLVDQLLALARLDELARQSAPAGEVQLTRVYEDVMTELAPQLLRAKVSVQAQLAAPEMRGSEFGVTTMLRNLVSNAIRHSPEGGRVSLEVESCGGDVLLTVDDTGPGIPPEEREHVFDRFSRGRASHPDGVGLGLAIVQSIADLHGAAVQLLDSPLGGLRVQVRFPKAALPRSMPA